MVAGREMMTRYVVAFETAGLLLTVALVGAVALAYREGDDAETPRRGVRPTRALGATTLKQGNGRGEESNTPDQAVTTTTS
jgi:NADH-quinone oxidoreductase subunit J